MFTEKYILVIKSLKIGTQDMIYWVKNGWIFLFESLDISSSTVMVLTI